MPGLVSMLPGGRPPFDVSSGTVALFKDPNWFGGRLELSIDGGDTNTPNVEYNINGHWMDDQATWAAYNLPEGVVVTLHEHAVARAFAVDVSGCGKVVDLVGTGQTEGVNLEEIGFDDTMTAWFWRYVDLDLGAVELYADPWYTGSRTVVFLSDWEPGTIHNISSWWINDRCSSVKWHTLDDRVNCALYADVQAGSSKLLTGYNKAREIANLQEQNMDDNISSFIWKGLVPKREIIKPFQIALNLDVGETKTFTNAVTHYNEKDVDEVFAVELGQAQAETLTVTTTDSHRVGFATTVAYSAEAGVEGIAKVSSSLSVTMSYDYTKTEEKATSTTRTNTLSFSKTFNASARKTTVGTLIVRVGMVPRTPFETTARRWYDVQMSGSERDTDFRGWYVRDETVKSYLEGGLRAEVEVLSYYLPFSRTAL
jgi:hypothetical protein